MRSCLVVAIVALSGGAALADAAFNPEFYRFLKDRGLEEQAFNYAVTWAGSADGEAETAVAYALLDGVGVEANPRAAIEIACRSASMDDFDVGVILVQGNLRLASKDFRPIRCEGNE